jgi:hypothetical protein
MGQMDGLWYRAPQKLCISQKKIQDSLAWAGIFRFAQGKVQVQNGGQAAQHI